MEVKSKLIVSLAAWTASELELDARAFQKRRKAEANSMQFLLETRGGLVVHCALFS